MPELKSNNNKTLWSLYDECINFLIVLDDPIQRQLIPTLIEHEMKGKLVDKDDINTIKILKSILVAHNALLVDCIENTKDLRIIDASSNVVHYLKMLLNSINILNKLYLANQGRQISISIELKALKNNLDKLREQIFLFNKIPSGLLNEYEPLKKIAN